MNRSRVGVVVIGRNEGERLRRCLTSVAGSAVRVYVDSGSTDGSQSLARSLGFQVVDLDTSQGFTAARARNAGLDQLASNDQLEFVQFVDGDCEVREDWIDNAMLDFSADVAVVFGRRRERHPNRNIFHHSCDIEWDVPAGEVLSCGGDALFRLSALRQVGGYNPLLIAGEVPELCLRLRRKGWKIISNAKEMTWHDVGIDHFGQWWRRSKRTGFGFAALLDVHGAGSDGYWRRLLLSAGAWSLVMVGAAFLLIVSIVAQSLFAVVGFVLALSLLAFGIFRTATRARQQFASFGEALRWGGLLYVSKLAQAQGWISQRFARRKAEQARIIEYK